MTDYPKNSINEVGFPEGQLLANGASKEECAEISAAFLTGTPIPETHLPVVNQVSARLAQLPEYQERGGAA